MRLLFDTHVWLWYAHGDSSLPMRFVEAIQDPSNTVVISVVSAWEVQIKSATGKLQLQSPIDTLFDDASRRFDVLDISLRHIRTLRSLATHHRDPFDRMLVAQAMSDDLTIMTVDSLIKAYGVACLPL